MLLPGLLAEWWSAWVESSGRVTRVGKNKVAVGYLHKEVAKCRLITEYGLNMKSTCFRTHHQVGGAATGTGITRYNDSRVWGAGQVPGRTTDQATMPCQQEAKFSATVLISPTFFSHD